MWKYIFLYCTMAMLSNNSTSQSIIKLTEKDREDLRFINYKNADINSIIILQLDKSKLLEKINPSGESNLPTEVDNLLSVLKGALNKKQEWIDGFVDAVRAYTEGNKKELDDFNAKRAGLAKDILLILKKDEKLFDYFEQDESLNIWQQLTNALTRRIAEVEQQLLTSGKYSDIRVQLGGWLIHNNEPTPLHFDGLDTNPSGEFYEVERWKFMPTPEQIANFEEAQQLAKTDSLKEANISEIVRSKYVKIFVDKLKEQLTAGIEELKKKAEQIVSTLGGAGAVKTDVETIIADSKVLIDLLNSKIEFYSTLKNNPDFTLSLLFTTVAADIDEFNSKGIAFKKHLEKLEKDLASATTAVKESAREILPLIKTSVISVSRELLTEAGFDIINSNRIDDLVLEFSEKVLSLTLKDFPADPQTDLRYAGFREPGDKVVVKLIVTKGESGTRIVQETKDITLYRILPHLEGTVGVVFAHPLSKTQLQKDFQMAPYYNFLFKGIFGCSQKWKRRSTLPNTILDMNFGIHLSSPDFNKDDVPELGVGIVASTLHDYVQFGWAYNIFNSTTYLYFGVKLPVPSMNFGSNSNSSARVDSK